MFFAERLVNMPTRARRFTSQASVGMFASRIPSSQLSKNDSFSTVKKRPVLHYTCAGRSICASFAPLAVYIYGFGGESCTTRHPLLRSARLAAPTVTAQCILGSWANGARVRLSLRGKARLLPRAASTVRSAILRRRDTAFSSRARPLAHHANCRRAVPLRSFLAHAPLARPSAMARFFS